MHLVAELLLGAARGDHLPADGAWRRVEPWRDGIEAIVAFTGHAVLVVGPSVSDAELDRLYLDGYGGASDPKVAVSLAGDGGWIDSLDLVLGAHPPAAPSQAPSPKPRPPQPAEVALVPRPDLAEHPRAAFARALRDDVVVYGWPDRSRADVVVVSRGIGGLPELSFAVAPERRGRGEAVELVRAALRLLAGEELVVAAAAPGNAASVRTLLGAGFVPLGSVQLIRPRGRERAART